MTRTGENTPHVCMIAGFDERDRAVLAQWVAALAWTTRFAAADAMPGTSAGASALIWNEPAGAQARWVVEYIRAWAAAEVRVLCQLRATPVALALRSGAVDALNSVSPFELLERTRLMLQEESSQSGTFLAVGQVKVSLTTGEVVQGGRRQSRLTHTQLKVFRYLVDRPGEFVATSALQKEVLCSHGSGGAVRYHICRIRRALGESGGAIEERRRFGYRFYTPCSIGAASEGELVGDADVRLVGDRGGRKGG